jgi:hypothetical protein
MRLARYYKRFGVVVLLDFRTFDFRVCCLLRTASSSKYLAKIMTRDRATFTNYDTSFESESTSIPNSTLRRTSILSLIHSKSASTESLSQHMVSSSYS